MYQCCPKITGVYRYACMYKNYKAICENDIIYLYKNNELKDSIRKDNIGTNVSLSSWLETYVNKVIETCS